MMYSAKDFCVGDYVQFVYHNTMRSGSVERVENAFIRLSHIISGVTVYKSYRYDKMSKLKVLDTQV